MSLERPSKVQLSCITVNIFFTRLIFLRPLTRTFLFIRYIHVNNNDSEIANNYQSFLESRQALCTRLVRLYLFGIDKITTELYYIPVLKMRKERLITLVSFLILGPSTAYKSCFKLPCMTSQALEGEKKATLMNCCPNRVFLKAHLFD